MKVKYNIIGAARKELVNAVSEVIGIQPQYQGVPRCGYQIGRFVIDKQGTLILPAETDADVVERLLAQLTMKGFPYVEREDDTPDDDTPEADRGAVQMPLALELSEPQELADELEAESETELVPDEPEVEPAHTEALESGGPQDEAPAPETASEERAAFTVEVPLEGFTDAHLLNLEKLIASKASLIKKSLGVDALPIVKTGERLAFPWFRRELTSFEI